MADKANPLVNPIAQDLLDRLGIPFEIQSNVLPEKIEASRAEGAQVRAIEHIAPEKTVRKYADAMGRGHKFPAVVVTQDFRLLDGNTRFGAAQIARVSLNVIRVTIPLSRTQERMIQGYLNVTHGNPLTNKEKRTTAESMLLTNPRPPIEEIAAATGTSPTSIKRWAAIIDFRDRGERQSVGLAGIKDATLLLLAELKDDALLADVVRLTREARLPDDEVKTLVSDVNNGLAVSTEKAETILDDWKTRKNPVILETKTIGDVVPAREVESALHRTLGLDPEVTLRVPAAELSDLLVQIEEADAIINRMLELGRARLLSAAT